MTKKEFVFQYIKKHNESGLKNFPDDFTDLTDAIKHQLPAETLVLGNEFFGKYEILTTDGSPVMNADNIFKAKYIIYGNRDREGYIFIPEDESKIKSAVEKYERYLDQILTDISEDLKKHMPELLNDHSISNEIFMKLNLVRY